MGSRAKGMRSIFAAKSSPMVSSSRSGFLSQHINFFRSASWRCELAEAEQEEASLEESLVKVVDCRVRARCVSGSVRGFIWIEA